MGSLPGEISQTLLLAGRELASRLTSPWLFVVATVPCVMAWFFGDAFLRSFETESVLVTADPLMVLNAAIVIFLAVVLGLRMASSLAWEREHRTLEVLAVGPVSLEAVVLAKFTAEAIVLLLLIATYLGYLLVAQPLGVGVLGVGDAVSVGRGLLHALPFLAFGLLISAGARTVRSAIILYLALALLLGLFELALRVSDGASINQLNLAAAYVRAGLQAAEAAVDFISPVARLADLLDVADMERQAATLGTSLALASTILMLLLAMLLVRRRGALA